MTKSSRNQTITLSDKDIEELKVNLIEINNKISNLQEIENKTIIGNTENEVKEFSKSIKPVSRRK